MPLGAQGSPTYVVQLGTLVRDSALQLVRPASHGKRAEARRHLARHALLLSAIFCAGIVVLMVGLDAREIALMPRRGAPDLWPVRIITDFGKDAYVLWALLAAMIITAIAGPSLQGRSRERAFMLLTHLQFLFFAVLVSVLLAEIVKWAVGRGRPFVGGKADPFNFAPFTGSEAYFSFPSAHAVTAFALAFAVGAVWPRMRIAMFVYACAIAASRLVLLAHHPSDVVAGALVGVLGALAVRYWFAARQLGFSVQGDGKIVPL